jgi:hypothetical protein
VGLRRLQRSSRRGENPDLAVGENTITSKRMSLILLARAFDMAGILASTPVVGLQSFGLPQTRFLGI